MQRSIKTILVGATLQKYTAPITENNDKSPGDCRLRTVCWKANRKFFPEYMSVQILSPLFLSTIHVPCFLVYLVKFCQNQYAVPGYNLQTKANIELHHMVSLDFGGI